MNNPKFEQKLKQKVITPNTNQQLTSGYAIVLSYDSQANTACIQMNQKKGSGLGQIYQNVVCPTNIGVQGVTPEPGRPCFVDFNGTTDFFPVITHFFNHVYNNIDYTKQSTSVNNLPRYILGT